MHHFFKTNYLNVNSRPPGVYHLYKEQKGKRLNFFFVRVINDAGCCTTIAKCETRKEANKLFRKYMGKEIPIHYEEIGNMTTTK